MVYSFPSKLYFIDLHSGTEKNPFASRNGALTARPAMVNDVRSLEAITLNLRPSDVPLSTASA